ncbi:MAG: Na/Pi cotransporter family protein [Bacteroidales bacterium]|nr:Na/Pi cotransporter family protein [Bacteroidales bacterium]
MQTVLYILTLIGSLGVFLYGMTVMSESIQKLAGSGLRGLLSKMTSNRFKGILTGIGVTSIIQASAATIVMVVSFVNAGLISLEGSISVIMGANIGTTITAWIVSLLGFQVSVVSLTLPIIALATPLMFTKRYKTLGSFLIGFALLFYGLGLMQSQVPDFTQPQYFYIVNYISELSSHSYLSVILFVAVGTVVTFIIQSSSAMMAVTLVMCSKGLISFEMACALCLGENIGTTLTANLAAMVANESAKRAARAHLLFNLAGVVWVLALFYPVTHLIDFLSESWGLGDPTTHSTAIPIALSLFHSFFNVSNTLILVWFIPYIVKILYKLVPEKNGEEVFRLEYIRKGLINSGEIALEPAKKEIEVFAKRVVKMFDFIPQLFACSENREINKLEERTAKYEDITDRMEVEIAAYLSHVAQSEMSAKATKTMEAMLKIIDNLESVGDECYQLSLSLKTKHEQRIEFSDTMNINLLLMFDMVKSSLQEMESNLLLPYENVDGTKAQELEDEINLHRDRLREEHTEAIKKNEYSYQTGIVYSNIYSQLEKLADYVINVTEAITKKNF